MEQFVNPNEIQRVSHVIDVGLDVMLSTSVASTTLKWRTFELLR
jgi:hypothetical protein